MNFLKRRNKFDWIAISCYIFMVFVILGEGYWNHARAGDVQWNIQLHWQVPHKHYLGCIHYPHPPCQYNCPGDTLGTDRGLDSYYFLFWPYPPGVTGSFVGLYWPKNGIFLDQWVTNPHFALKTFSTKISVKSLNLAKKSINHQFTSLYMPPTAQNESLKIGIFGIFSKPKFHWRKPTKSFCRKRL